jgi:hypothetical protein
LCTLNYFSATLFGHLLLKVSPSFYISTLFDNANMAGARTFYVRANHCKALKPLYACRPVPITKKQFEPNGQTIWRLPEIIWTTTEIYIVTRATCRFYSPLLGLSLFVSSVIFLTQTVGFLRRVISPSQGRYLHTGRHKHRINAHTDTHAFSGIRTHEHRIRGSEVSSYLTPRDHCDRHMLD